MSSGDYISKSALIEEIKKQKDDNDMHCRLCMDAMIEIIEEQPTPDEKEIIRKAFERVLQRLDKQAGEFIDLSHRELSNNSIPAIKYLNKGFGVARAIEIVKEECGINE